MREKFRRFMTGRYGVDDLGRFTLYLSLGLLILSFLSDTGYCIILAGGAAGDLLSADVLTEYFPQIRRKSEVSGLERQK